MLDRKKALLINFTADAYHWGCYGTSMEIYTTLIESGYFIETRSVYEVHTLKPTPQNNNEFYDNNFFKKYSEENQDLCRSISNSDVIVINAEGTLHGLAKGPINLLYLMLISKKYFKKVVHLINFSCFPNGDNTAPKDNTAIYIDVLKMLDNVVVREIFSENLLKEVGIKAMSGFDCLPRFLSRYNLTERTKSNECVLVSGGVRMPEEYVSFYVKFINWLYSKNIPVRFLVGAKSDPDNAEYKFWHYLKQTTKHKDMKLVDAKSFKSWADEFRSASFFFSARFHHTIAALSIGTPFAVLPSNTQKISAMLNTISSTVACLSPDEDGFLKLQELVNNRSNQNLKSHDGEILEKMIEGGKKNFDNL